MSARAGEACLQEHGVVVSDGRRAVAQRQAAAAAAPGVGPDLQHRLAQKSLSSKLGHGVQGSRRHEPHGRIQANGEHASVTGFAHDCAVRTYARQPCTPSERVL